VQVDLLLSECLLINILSKAATTSMYADPTSDPFLSELADLYETLCLTFYPYYLGGRTWNRRYYAPYKFFKNERKRVRRFVCNGLFVDNESRERVLLTLNRVILILPHIPKEPIPFKKNITPNLVLEDVIRVRDAVELVDSLED
jgi:hypothetical protein